MIETRIKKANKILKIITLSLIGAVVVFAMIIGGFCLAGYKVLWVLGDSSIQYIKPYSLILVKPCTVEELVARDRTQGIEMGDFAVRVLSTGRYVTHEVCAKELDVNTGVWYFDTIQAGKDDRTDETDGGGKCVFDQDDLVGKVVAKESLIGKLLAWVQGYPNIDTTLGASNPDKTLAFVRIVSLAFVLYGIGKFADFMHYKEESVY